MTTDRAEEYSKFVPNKLNYEVVPSLSKGEHFQLNACTTTIPSKSNDDHSSSRRGIRRQIICTCAVLILSAACGMPIGYSAVLLPQLSDKNATSEIAIDIEMGSWIASVHSLATPMGSLLSGPLADYFGRRSTLLLSVIPVFIGWCILATAQSFGFLLAGRLLCGFATGILAGPCQIYIAETATPNLRGLLIGAPYVSYSLGILFVYALGASLHWRTVAWCGNLLPALAATAIFCIPESPVWLVRNQKLSRALRALSFLRGNELVAQKELSEMQQRLQKERELSQSNEEGMSIFQLCCQPFALKPLVIVCLFCFLQMFSGTFIVVFYAIDIISEFGANFDAKTAAIWTAIVRMICTIISCAVLLLVRRRCMLQVSSLVSGLSCLVLSIYMYTRMHAAKTSTDILVIGTCLLIYIAFNTALMILPGIMVGELFPARIRGRTVGGVFAIMNVSLFGLTKVFPLIQATIKMRGVFMLFAVSSLLITLIMYLLQPETKGRTLDNIEDYFNEDHWLWYKRDKTYKMVAKSEQKKQMSEA